MSAKKRPPSGGAKKKKGGGGGTENGEPANRHGVNFPPDMADELKELNLQVHDGTVQVGAAQIDNFPNSVSGIFDRTLITNQAIIGKFF